MVCDFTRDNKNGILLFFFLTRVSNIHLGKKWHHQQERFSGFCKGGVKSIGQREFRGSRTFAYPFFPFRKDLYHRGNPKLDSKLEQKRYPRFAARKEEQRRPTSLPRTVKEATPRASPIDCGRYLCLLSEPDFAVSDQRRKSPEDYRQRKRKTNVNTHDSFDSASRSPLLVCLARRIEVSVVL